MRYKGNLVLLEMMIVLIFFALSAVISAGVLANAFVVVHDSRDKTRALYIAQEWAEKIAASDDPVALLKGAGTADADGYRIGAGDYEVSAVVGEEKTGAGAFFSIDLTVYRAGEAVLTLPAGRYVPGEVAP